MSLLPVLLPPPTDVRGVLDSWGHESLWQTLQIDGDGSWLLEGLTLGTVEGASDGFYHISVLYQFQSPCKSQSPRR